jgi:hypothetical protein
VVASGLAIPVGFPIASIVRADIDVDIYFTIISWPCLGNRTRS